MDTKPEVLEQFYVLPYYTNTNAWHTYANVTMHRVRVTVEYFPEDEDVVGPHETDYDDADN